MELTKYMTKEIPELVPDMVGIGTGLVATPLITGAIDQAIVANMGANAVYGKIGERVGIGVVDAFIMSQTMSKKDDWQSGIFYGALTSLVVIVLDTAILIYNTATGALKIPGAPKLSAQPPVVTTNKTPGVLSVV